MILPEGQDSQNKSHHFSADCLGHRYFCAELRKKSTENINKGCLDKDIVTFTEKSEQQQSYSCEFLPEQKLILSLQKRF